MSGIENSPTFLSEVLTLKDESTTVQSLQEEFTQRIAEAERKAQLACKERDISKKVDAHRLLSSSRHTPLLLSQAERTDGLSERP